MKFKLEIMARMAVLLSCLAAMSVVAQAQQRPLITEDVDIIPPGTVRIEAGLDFLQGAKFPASGLTGDLTRVGVIGVTIGFAPNVEFQIEGVAQNFLSINTVGHLQSRCRWRQEPTPPTIPVISFSGPNSNYAAKPNVDPL